MVIQIVLALLGFLAVGAVVGGPVAAAFISATTTLTAALTTSGPQLNFNVSALTGAWSVCYSALYSVPMYPNISSILSTCYKSKLLLGCRPVGNALLTVAAMGNRADVLFNCSASNTMTNQANGVGWYFSMDAGNWNSWGFVLGSNSVLRNNCDGDMSTNPAYRLCWHLIGTAGG